MLLLNNLDIESFFFPGGEIQVRVPEFLLEERATLTWKPTKPDDIVKLMLVVNALRNNGIYDIHLDCLYLPYARQDRVCSVGEANSLEVIASILESIRFSSINVWDVHNEHAFFQLMPHTFVTNIECIDILKRYKLINDFDVDDLFVCAVDYGAYFRASGVNEQFGARDLLRLRKNRGPISGDILSLSFSDSGRDFDGADVLIVDDICDGGSTFIEAAKLLRQHTSGALYLYVTHGIFSKGLDELLNYYTHIYCHHVLDDYAFQSTDKLTILRSFSYVRS